MLTDDQKNAIRAMISESSNQISAQESFSKMSEAEIATKITEWLNSNSLVRWQNRQSGLLRDIARLQGLLNSTNQIVNTIVILMTPPIP